MRLLLDTHVFLWWVEGDRALPRRARAAISDPDNECFLSTASAWEMAIKSSLGKLRIALPVRRYVTDHLAANAFALLGIGLAHLGRLEGLPQHHGDPFDRVLISQALEEEMTVVTADPVFRKYGIRRLWS